MKPIWRFCLTTSILFCLGCDSSREHTQDNLLWLQPVEFSKETKVWLEGLDWPESAFVDFGKLAQHNNAIRRIKHTPQASP